MPKYTASDLKHRITRLVKTSVPDGGGGSTEQYVAESPEMKTWAKIEPKSAFERYYAGATSSQERTLIVIRYQPGWDQTMRIAYGSRRFDVLGIVDLDERHEWLELDCEERHGE